jgi:diguanylate cyclase (GGDEF)-like protein/PAS domain S-box-containing protein
LLPVKIAKAEGVREGQAHFGVAPRHPRPRRYRAALRLLGCFASILLSVVLVGLFGRDATGANIIWLSNGLLLAYLLVVPRWRWPAYLAVSVAGLVLGSALIHESWRMNLLYNALDLIEVGMAALLLRRRSTDLPRFTDGAYLLRFLGFAVLGAPLAAALLMALYSYLAWQSAPVPVTLKWLGTDSVGIAVATPVFVAVFQNSLKGAFRQTRDCVYLLLLTAVTVGVFAQPWAPVTFIVYPFLLLVQLRLGLGWTAIGTIFVTLTAGTLTARGFGPLSGAVGVSPAMRPLLLQLFVIAAVVMMYSISVVRESERSIGRKLEEIVSIHRLISENSRDVILITDFDGRMNYVSPAAKSMWGWEADELARMRSLDLVDAEDRAKFAAVLREMRSGPEGATVEHRARTRGGESIWVESSLRAIRDPVTRVATGVLEIVRDISERKQTEKELEAAYRTVEALAVEDALTGLANRRRLDECLTSEWRRGLRDRRPLSFLLADVDHFKSYNDTYGHVRGDGCLKQIAEAAQEVVARPGDLAARYGGEEFGIVLPDTDAAGARDIAGLICAALRRRALEHQSNPEGIVTISIGCATLVPNHDQSSGDLVEMADKALYDAKNGGRNRVCPEKLPESGDDGGWGEAELAS